VTIGFVPRGEVEDSSRTQEVGIPLYMSASREELLLELAMPIEGEEDKWVLAGVALLMADD
jgi:hypothetical protein